VLSERALFEGFLNGYKRQFAVIWFSDIQGFSEAALSIPAELVGYFVQDFLVAQVDAITSRQGEIDKFMGDGVMAFWPVPTEALLDRICAAALEAAEESVTKVQRIKFRDSHLDVRVGLHAGEVLSGNFGLLHGPRSRAQYSLIGSEVNKAARLEQARHPDEGRTLGWIRTSEEFFRHLPEVARTRLPESVAGVKAKNMGTMTVHTTGA
jgi:class 3 adenylate cyclase